LSRILIAPLTEFIKTNFFGRINPEQAGLTRINLSGLPAGIPPGDGVGASKPAKEITEIL
jgi:hypothetical protein